MSVVEIDTLVPEVLTLARNAPEPLVLRELRAAARRFCQATKAWREEDRFEVVAPEYEGLFTSSEADIVAIEQAALDGHPLDPVSVVDLDRRHFGWSRDTEAGSARFITQLTPNSLTIYPRQTGTLDLRLVLKPSLTCVTIPGWLADEYGRDLARGAAGELLVLPNTEYQNLALGQLHMSGFTSFIARKKVSVAKTQAGAPLRMKGSFF